MACSHHRRGQDNTVLSGPRRRCEHNCRQDKTVLSHPCPRCKHNWGPDKTVLSCLQLCSHRQSNKTILTVLSRLQLCSNRQRGQDKSVLSCRAGGVNTTADKTRQFCLVSSRDETKLSCWRCEQAIRDPACI